MKNLRVKSINFFFLTLFLAHATTFHAVAQSIRVYSDISRDEDGTQYYKVRRNNSSLNLKYRGEIQFSDDDRNIASIEPGGFLTVSKKTFGNKRTVEVESDSQGKLSFKYFIGRKEEPFTPDGKEWLGDVLLEIIRMTGMGAEERTKRLYEKNGATAVFNEIDEISSDYVKTRYFSTFFSLEGLQEVEMGEGIEKMSRDIDSDYEKARVFRENSLMLLKSEPLSKLFFEGISRIDSDFEKGKLLKGILRKEELNSEQLVELSGVAYDIDSDFEKAGVCKGLILQFRDGDPKLNTESKDAIMKTISSIDSDFELGNVLSELLSIDQASMLDIHEVFEISENMDSDFEKGKILQQASVMLTRNHAKPENIILLFDAIRTIDSDFEKGKVLKNFLMYHRSDFTTQQKLALFHVLDAFDSSYESSKILKQSTRFLGDEEQVNHAFFMAVRNLDSSYEQGEILGNLSQQRNLKEGTMLGILEAVEDVSSSYEQGKILINLAPNLPKNDKFRDAYRQAASSIDSDYEYRKVMDAYTY